MATIRFRRAGILLLFFLLELVSPKYEYFVPDVTIEVYKPKGIKVSTALIPDLRSFDFRANVNEDIDVLSKGTISGSLVETTNGLLEFEDTEVQLKVGDVINYVLMVLMNGEIASFTKLGLTHTVTELKERSGPPLMTTTSRPRTTSRPTKCYPTLTRVRGGKACGGQTIFEDDFSTLQEDVWQIEQYVPITSHPEHPYVIYINMIEDEMVYVSNGSLHIAPRIFQHQQGIDNETVATGEYNLDTESGCTSRREECYLKASGADILPPVVSGRVTSARFAFTYGTVHIKAKLPQGDWLYPELLLEPFLKKYGLFDYASGVMKIASARGNKELNLGATSYGNEVLYGGPVMDVQCRQQLLASTVLQGDLWGNDFHEYSLTWTPNYISLAVDGREWAHINADSSLLARFSRSCTHLPREKLLRGSKMAPFDDDFYITLGVAAGGVTEFPDDSYSGGGRLKPWRNSARKGMLNFWKDLPNWEKTWTQPNLVIDHIKVVAL